MSLDVSGFIFRLVFVFIDLFDFAFEILLGPFET